MWRLRILLKRPGASVGIESEIKTDSPQVLKKLKRLIIIKSPLLMWLGRRGDKWMTAEDSRCRRAVTRQWHQTQEKPQCWQALSSEEGPDWYDSTEPQEHQLSGGGEATLSKSLLRTRTTTSMTIWCWCKWKIVLRLPRSYIHEAGQKSFCFSSVRSTYSTISHAFYYWNHKNVLLLCCQRFFH